MAYAICDKCKCASTWDATRGAKLVQAACPWCRAAGGMLAAKFLDFYKDKALYVTTGLKRIFATRWGPVELTKEERAHYKA